MARLALIFFAMLCLPAAALGADAARRSASRPRRWSAPGNSPTPTATRYAPSTFNGDPAPVGFKVEFDENCGTLFPLVNDVVGWKFPDNDLLHLLDAQGKSLVEFSEVEDGIYEAPTPGVGVLFLQNAARPPAPAPKPPEQVAGDWAIMRGSGAPLCHLTLATTAAQDGLALTVKPGCDPAIARLNLTLWRIDRDELMLVPARGNPWRFEEVDGKSWRRIPESERRRSCWCASNRRRRGCS